ncbi:hypothetical protein [Silanimonas sp.]|uniref:hypothetical protein n=1 Tax=Silanimonas sp. TaxID=1929290 RepID=UPI0022C9034C|nr:hypothetical protein [Silanimonas sp.]MCZ8063929.1 hypothetical protein [Silanimonas sp.]
MLNYSSLGESILASLEKRLNDASSRDDKEAVALIRAEIADALCALSASDVALRKKYGALASKTT